MIRCPAWRLILVYNIIIFVTSAVYIHDKETGAWAGVAMACVMLATLLLIHHHHDHGQPQTPNFIQDEDERCFQMSDVGNFRTCNHEMWILGFMLVAFICLCIAIGVEIG
jgi:hypothetical protein